ncbi:LPS export ABC transporter ATP-binding protein [bacterium]|nr:LPS export ABC transporter ATP-binding protein [bacterium]
MALLEVEGLVKYFGRRLVVNGVSFTVNAGEVVGLLGPNGAGKTTSFRMATGQIPPNAGKVTFNTEDVTGLPMFQRARRGMGYLSQEPSVFKKLSVENNLIAILEALPRSRSLGRKLSRRERWDRTNEALTRFKLDHVRKNTAGRCSGGEKRRLEIARCLVCEPLLILLDEPFAAVDPKTTEDIRQNIRDLANTGIGILITDHNVREVFRTADRVYLIADGKVVTHGTPHELVNDQRAIDAYLGRSFEEDGFTRAMATKLQPGGATPAPVSPPPPPAPAPAPKATRVAVPSGLEDATRPTKPLPPAAVAPPPPPPPKPSVTPPPAKPLTVTPAPVPLPPRPAPPPKAAAAPDVTTVTPPPVLFPAAAPALPATTAAPASGVFSGAVGSMLEQEKVRRLVESLADDAAVKGATLELVKKGAAALPVLLEALEWPTAAHRRRAFEVLKFLAKDAGPLEYDPDAPKDVRQRQAAYLRNRLEARR